MMILHTTPLILCIALLLLIEGFYSGSEIALLSTDRLWIETEFKRHPARYRALRQLLERPECVIATTLLMTSLCVVAISTLILFYFHSHASPHMELKAIATTSPLIVILGELIPKTFFQRFAPRVAPWIAYPIRWTYFALFPLTRLIASYNLRLARIVGPVEELLSGKKRTTRDDIRSILTADNKDSALKKNEKKLIRRILDFKEAETQHALIPLIRVEAVEENEPLRIALEKFQNNRFSRMPVYSSRIDNLVGILKASDLLGSTDLEGSIKAHIKPAFYAPETQSLEDLLVEMRKTKNEIAVVVDEYGGAIGILTQEDILEEIVGEIRDEYDTDTTPIHSSGKNKWVIQARTEIQLLNEQLALQLPEGNYETLAGFLLELYGRIPKTGEELYFDTPLGQLRFEIRKANPRQIHVVELELVLQKEIDSFT